MDLEVLLFLVGGCSGGCAAVVDMLIIIVRERKKERERIKIFRKYDLIIEAGDLEPRAQGGDTVPDSTTVAMSLPRGAQAQSELKQSP